MIEAFLWRLLSIKMDERATTARQNFMQMLNNTPRVHRVGIYISTGLVLCLTVAISVCLALSKGSCDQPLQLYLYIYLVALIIAHPFQIYLILKCTTNAAGVQINSTPEETFIINRLTKIKSLWDLLSAAWFLAGNWWVFSSTNCALQTPLVYWMCVTVLAVQYSLICVSHSLLITSFLFLFLLHLFFASLVPFGSQDG